MTVHLPDDLEQFVRAEILSGRYASEEHAISEAVLIFVNTGGRFARFVPSDPDHSTARD